KDPVKAMEWFEKAALNGCLSSQWKLGKILWRGIKDENEQKIIKKDPVKAMEWFEKAALNGCLSSQWKLGKILRDGVRDKNEQEIIKRDPVKAMHWVKTAAQAGNSRAQVELGKILFRGIKDENGQEIIEKNLKKAVDWFKEAARNEYPEAQFYFGLTLWTGIKDENGQEIIEKNLKKAVDSIQAAASYKHPAAQFKLGSILWTGIKDENGQEIIEKNLKKAVDWIQSAASYDHPEAKFKFWSILSSGIKDENGQEIIEKDDKRAMIYLRSAAQQKHKEAIEALKKLQPALHAAVVLKNTFNARSAWKFNPAGLRNATEDELKLYEEIIKRVEESTLTSAEKQRTKNALLRFKTLHANNKAICKELMESTEVRNYSESIYAVTPQDILIHPEQGDANLEQRAHIIYNILETTYNGVKKTPLSLEKFFKEAFSDTIPCLEAQSRKIDDWRASQEAIEVKISHQSISQNIGEFANQLQEDMNKNSETGKKVIEATQDYEMLDVSLKEAEPKIRTASLKHTSSNIKTLEKKHAKWLKKNNKYEEMRQNLLTTLVGKTAKDGEITENAINNILSGLGWDFGNQK
ncbi:MAG: SEL1-like repeat protein, partial [Alphaproteobacteria bacterium]|nr:SEL1-like repeat protein [Alphaproteobacteria bacterium]